MMSTSELLFYIAVPATIGECLYMLYNAGKRRKLFLSNTFLVEYRYQVIGFVFFISNIILLEMCGFCDHCYLQLVLIPLSGSFIGISIYLIHLIRTTIKNFKEGKPDPMNILFSIPYLIASSQIIQSIILNNNFSSLHQIEKSMLIGCMYGLHSIVLEMIIFFRQKSL